MRKRQWSEPSEALGELTKAVQGIQVGGVAIAGNRLAVELDAPLRQDKMSALVLNGLEEGL